MLSLKSDHILGKELHKVHDLPQGSILQLVQSITEIEYEGKEMCCYDIRIEYNSNDVHYLKVVRYS